MTIVIVVPVLGRPASAEPLLESIEAAASVSVLTVFVCDSHDEAQAAECKRLMHTHVDVSLFTGEFPEHGNYAAKINRGVSAFVRLADADWILQAADDLRFHPGWDTAALEVAAETGARVIGTNDLGHRQVKLGRHSTHSLIARSYIDEGCTVDAIPGVVLCESYSHNFCDVELIETAKARGEFAAARDSVVEHLHPLWKKGEWDATYERSLADYAADRELWRERSRLVLGEQRRRARQTA